MTTMTRLLRSTVLLVVGAVASCGPRRAPVVDIDRIKAQYCERAVQCIDDPDVDFELCMQRLDEYGIEHGGYYDEQGCLDEETAFLECLTGLACDDLYWARYSLEDGPCNPEWYAVLEAGCDPVEG